MTPQPLVPYADVTDSVLDLRRLSTALSSFHRHFDLLHSHLLFISSSIDSLSLLNSPFHPPLSENPPISAQSPVLKEKSTISEPALVYPPEETLNSEQSERFLFLQKSPVLDNPQISEKSSGGALIYPCEETLYSEQSERFLFLQKSPVLDNPQISEKSSGRALIYPSEETLYSEQSERFNFLQKSPILETPQVSEKSSGRTLIYPAEETLYSEQSERSIFLQKSPILDNPQISEKSSGRAIIYPLEETLNLEQSEVLSLCKLVKGNSLRKYILSNISDPGKLIEVPSALKLCPNPAKLVFDCVGQFYLMGTHFYRKSPSLNRSRQASILMLQFFLPVASESGTEVLVREEAGRAAVAWRKRMINEGGLEKCSEIDAKGLLLFIGCFGIPKEFEDDDVLDLLKASNGREISALLCRSDILVKKMKEIIESLQKKEMDAKALDISLIFRLEDRYSPESISKSFIQQSRRDAMFARESRDMMKWDRVMVSLGKQLANLKSFVKCLEEHKVHPSDLLLEWDPSKKMTRIEEELAELENKQEQSEVASVSKSPSEINLASEQSEVVSLCKSLNVNGLKKYIISHLSEMKKLIEEVPSALKLCPNPAKLVLDCIDEFYLLGSDAYRNNPSLNLSRQAFVLLLQCFLPVVTESETENLPREEAVKAVVAWRKRMINESGLGKASEIDAKGLLLFIGCFGVPNEFEDDDVLDLLRASNGKEISVLLRGSDILVKKMKEILEAKQKMGLDVEALDISFTFRLYGNYSPGKILTSFLTQSRKDFSFAKKSREDLKLNQAIVTCKKQLANFESLLKCFEVHNVHPSDIMNAWNPKKNITKIERELAVLEKMRDDVLKDKTKRKADQLEPSMKAEIKDQNTHYVGAKNEDISRPSRSARRKRLKRACFRNGSEIQDDASLGDTVPSSINKLPNSSPVNRNKPFSLPGARINDLPSSPYHIEDALYNERFAGRGFSEPEKFVGRNYVESDRFVGRSYMNPIDHGFYGSSSSDPLSDLKYPPANISGISGRSYVKPVEHGANNGLLISDPLSDLCAKYLKNTPSGISGISERGSDSDIYGFADAVLEGDAAYGRFRESGTVPSTRRPSYLY